LLSIKVVRAGEGSQDLLIFINLIITVPQWLPILVENLEIDTYSWFPDPAIFSGARWTAGMLLVINKPVGHIS
jgi:hypothetical protein